MPHRRVDEFGPGILARGLDFRHNRIIIARVRSIRCHAVVLTTRPIGLLA
jgi:hypothetical protein